MTLNPELRDKVKTSLRAEKLPKYYFSWYVAYQWPGFGPYVVGFDDVEIADRLCDEFKAKGRDAVLMTEYPFELGII